DSGYFEIKRPSSDSYRIKVMYVGYNPDSLVTGMRISAESKTQIIQLTPTPYEIDAVVVKSNQIQNNCLSTTTNTTKLETKNFTNTSAMDEGDIVQHLKLTAGVSAVQDNLGGFNVRGGSSDQTLILFDGIPLYHADHLWGFNSTLNEKNVEKVQLHKGGLSAEYGNRLSGVLIADGKAGDPNELNLGIDANLYSIRGYINLPIYKNLNAYIHYNQNNDFVNPEQLISRDDYLFYNNYETKVIPGKEGDMHYIYGSNMPSSVKRFSDFYDFNSKITFRPGKNDSITISILDCRDEISLNSMLDSALTQNGIRSEKWSNRGASLQYSHKWNEKQTSEIMAVFSQYANNTNFAYRYLNDSLADSVTNSYTNHNDIMHQRYVVKHHSNFNHYFNFKIGFEYARLNTGFNRNFFQYDSVQQLLFKNEKHSSQFIGFIENSTNLFNRFHVSLGCRMLYDNNLDEILYKPRMQASVRLTEKITTDFSWGVFHQYMHRSPSVVQYNISSFSSTNSWLYSQDDLKPSHAQQFTAGINLNTQLFSLQLTGYHKIYKHLNFFIPFDTEYLSVPNDVRKFRSNYVEWLEDQYQFQFEKEEYRGDQLFTSSKSVDVFQGTGKSSGFEITLIKTHGVYTGSLVYHKSNTKHKFPYINLGNEFIPAYERVHEFKSVQNISWRNLNFGVSYVLASGKLIPSSYAYKNYLSAESITLEHPCKWDLNTNEFLPYYQTLNGGINYQFNLFKDLKAKLGFTAQNILAFNNILSKYYNYTFDENDEVAIDDKLKEQKDLGRIFNFFIQIEF
ncbi:MAG: TonB-dependent receptor, partial [Bacteroidales bacterium]|nr:TonB-dependent receptor [Bacteroidales bacterium]